MFKFFFLIVLFFPTFADAECKRTGNWETFKAGQATPRWFDVTKESDCIFETKYPTKDMFISAEVTIHPKNGQAGINSERILYIPDKGFVGEDYIQVNITLNTKLGEGVATLDIYYKVK